MTKEFSTHDIVLAASLSVSGYKLKSIEIKGTKGDFVFDAVDNDFLTRFDVGDVLVEPAAFNNSIRALTTAVKRQLNR